MDISVIILTYNEEIHIRRCLNNISDLVRDIYIIDSYSTDRTVDIAKQFDNVKILSHSWVNYATQFNWALENIKFRTKWILRLDADEYLTEELKSEIRVKLPTLPHDISGLIFPLRRVFLGRIIYRGTNRILLLRLFQTGKAKSEVRMMDEHIQLNDGKTIIFENEFVDDNLNNLTWWTNKHNGYAIREAVDLLDIELNLTGVATSDSDKNISSQAKNKRMLKHYYVKAPLFLRSFLYFIYRYFFKLGFLDGKEGFLWNFLQGWWYRTLVDAKVFEIKKACGTDKEKITKYLQEHYNITL